MRFTVIVMSILALAATSAQGAIFSGSSGDLAAQAEFSITGNELTVILTNTSTVDVTASNQALAGVFFNITGGTTLTKVSAFLTDGSTVLYADTADGTSTVNGTLNDTGDVGAEFAYRGDLSATIAGSAVAYGIGSSGFSLFGGGDRFDTVNDLDSPVSPDGSNYLITSAGDDPLTGNTGLMNDPIIKNSVTFTFTFDDTEFDLDDIADVAFQYGTDLSEPSFPGEPEDGIQVGDGAIPEPASLAAWGLLGIVGVGGVVRRRRNKKS